MVNHQPAAHVDSSTVFVYTQIPLNHLVFVHTGDIFKASYEISLFITDEDEKVVATDIWSEEVTREDYAVTRKSDEFHHSRTRLSLVPGEYKIVAHLVDLDNRERLTVRKPVKIEAYDREKIVIGIPLLLAPDSLGMFDPVNTFPIVDGRISNDIDSFSVLLTIRSPAEESKIAALKYRLYGEDEVLFKDSTSLTLQPGLTSHLINIPTEGMFAREYDIAINLNSEGDTVSHSLKVLVDWIGFSRSIGDIKEAVEQSRYVANRKQLAMMRDAKGESKREAFLEFWKSLDPTPETPRNELMDEYYMRVAYSNRQFETYQNGWESDRGMVYIIYGRPDDLESHPGSGNQRSYQIWTYYENNLRFVFEDANRFDDYRLVTPLYPAGVRR